MAQVGYLEGFLQPLLRQARTPEWEGMGSHARTADKGHIANVASLLAIVVVIGGVIVANAASASSDRSRTLCSGYSACEALGMSTHGYSENADTSYWHSYVGHNCTNYVAYVLESRGYRLPKIKGKTLSIGNATLWAQRAGDAGIIVDHRPTVGSVAQWIAGGSASKYGHVAIVEKITPEAITVSADNYAADGTGDYHWTVIATGSSAYPTNFIHFVD